MISLILKIISYKLFKLCGKPKMLPLNLTLNTTYHCPSRCQTCNIWKKEANEMTLFEWEKTLKNIGPSSVYWLILSGGEPFSRKDLPELCKIAYENLKPKVINIPTNGYLTENIFEAVKKILKYCPKSQLVINLSLDGIREKHDHIRNLPGSFENLLTSYREVKKIENPNLTIGIHTVISKLNYKNIPEIYEYVTRELKPDSYITEIAEKRIELDNKDLKIFPEFEEYQEAIDFLLSKMKKQKFREFSRITHSLRMEYYKLVKKIIREKRQVIPCYAGFASSQISAEGEVWPCCVLGKSMGNLRDHDYNFRKIWFSPKAQKIREAIKNKTCFCPLASASYTNMLMNIKKISKILFKLTI